MKPETHIKEEHATRKVILLLRLFCFFKKFFMKTKTLKTCIYKLKQTKEHPIKKKKPFIEIRGELNSDKPVNISNLSSLDKFTN